MKNHIMIFLKGLLMGVADIIPGVSGGTMAFITGIYDRFISALSQLSTAGKHFLKGEWKRGWKLIDFVFLIPLTIGITTAFVLGSLLIPSLMEHYPTYVFSFFIGLILVSAYIVYSHIRNHSMTSAGLLVLGILIGYLVASSPAFSTEGSLPFIGFMGILSVSAMLVPGISGSYVLLMFGQYEYILGALHDLNWPVLISFKIGAIIGLLLFSRILSWLLKRYHSFTFATLTGIMIGALYRPGNEALAASGTASLPLAACFLLLGMIIVVVVEKTAKHNA